MKMHEPAKQKAIAKIPLLIGAPHQSWTCNDDVDGVYRFAGRFRNNSFVPLDVIAMISLSFKENGGKKYRPIKKKEIHVTEDEPLPVDKWMQIETKLRLPELYIDADGWIECSVEFVTVDGKKVEIGEKRSLS